MNYPKFLILIFIFFIKSNFIAQLNGTYTIGGLSPDYPTIQSAVTNLNTQGISGNVIFKIRNGIYDEKIILGVINGSNDTSIVTFESESGITDSVWWNSSSINDATNYIVKCQNSKFIVFKNISFQGSGFGSKVFSLENNTSNIKIEYCHLKRSSMPNSNLLRHTLISSVNSIDSNLFIINNNFENAGYAYYSTGLSSVQKDFNINIFGNIISSFQTGLHLNNIENCTIDKNNITSSINGISISGFANPIKIINNEVKTNGLSILISNYLGVNLAGLSLYNNFIIGGNGALKILSGNGNCQIINNSIVCNSTTSSPVVEISTPGTLKNNILFHRGNGVALNATSITITVISDYNLMNTNGNFLVLRSGTGYSNLLNWQSSPLSQDLHSYQETPFFIGVNDLHILSSIYLDNNGEFDSQVLTDIDGEIRNIPPDIGADEFESELVEVGIKYSENQIVEKYNCSGQNEVNIKILNNGLDTLSSVLINYKVNDILQTPIIWSGSVPSFQESNDVGLFSDIIQDSFAIVKVWLSNPNGIVDINPYNDTLIVDTLYTRMQGNYTVGNSLANYPTLQSVADDLDKRGTCYNVIINIKNGIYFDGILLESLNRKTLNDTLFFQSESGLRDSVIWSQDFNIGKSLSVVKTSNIIIKDLTFKKHLFSNTLFNSFCVEIIYDFSFTQNWSSNIEIKNCIFTNLIEYTSGGIYSDYKNVRIIDCLFEKLNNGIVLKGDNLGPIPNEAGQASIKGNIFKNIGEIGLIVWDFSDIEIRNNVFHNYWINYPSNVNYPFQAIELHEIKENLLVENNKISGEFSKLFSLTNFEGSLTNIAQIQNNFFSCEYRRSFNNYSLIYLSEFVNFMHNSINVKHNSSLSTDDILTSIIYNTSLPFANNIVIKNNSFKADSLEYMFYGINTLNNSNFSPNNFFIEFIETAYDTYNNLVIPANNYSIDPTYISDSDLHLLEDGLLGLGENIGVIYDIDSVLRDTFPTIGAVEFKYKNYDISVSEIYSFIDCDSIKWMLNIENKGISDVDSIWISYNINNSLIDSILFTNTIQSGFTYDSIIFTEISIVYDSLYSLTTQILLVDSIDQYLPNNTNSLSITFNSTPSLSLGAADTTKCFDTPLILTPGNSSFINTVNWNNTSWGSSFFIDALDGQNTIQIIDIYNCEHFDTINVIVETVPVLPISYLNDTLYGIGQDVDWYYNGFLIALNISYYVPVLDGNYWYEWTSINGCEYLSNDFEYLSASVSENEYVEMKYFPNPFNEYIKLSDKDYIMNIEIFDCKMKSVGIYNNTDEKINTSQFSSGTYFIKTNFINGTSNYFRAIKI